MPVYEYRCADCSTNIEVHQAFSDDALTECPECGGRLKKVYGNVGIAFKGSGFYVNDSGASKSSTTSAASSASESSSSSSNGDTKKSETKSDSKATKSVKKADKPKAAATKSD